MSGQNYWIDFDGMPGAQDRVDLNLDQGPPSPLNLEPFGPNPWAGGGQSNVNIPSTGSRHDLGGPTPVPWWAWAVLAAMVVL